jgi:hypothetical protein
MDGRPPLERLETLLRDHPLGVDVAIAALVWFLTVLLPAGSYWPAEGTAFVVGTLLVVPLAWRRRRPVRAAAVVVAAGLLELVVVVVTVAGLLDSVLPARRAVRTSPVAAIAS